MAADPDEPTVHAHCRNILALAHYLEQVSITLTDADLMDEHVIRVEINGLISAAVSDILHDPIENILVCLNLVARFQVVVNELLDLGKLLLRNLRFSRSQCLCRVHCRQQFAQRECPVCRQLLSPVILRKVNAGRRLLVRNPFTAVLFSA